MKKTLLFLILTNIYFNGFASNLLKTGYWRAYLETNGGEMPFGLLIQKNTDQKTFTVYALNGAEKLAMDKSFIKQDSLHIPMGIFDSELIGKIENNRLVGIWKKKRTDGTFVIVGFKADYGKKYRFFENTQTSINSLTGTYPTTFQTEDRSKSSSAIGVFEQKNSTVTGTFLTTTGDYRYLEGQLHGDSLYLSTFDGNHAYLFKAKFDASKKALEGKYWSNGTIMKYWSANFDLSAKLPDEKSLTFLKEGYSTVDFAFPNEKNQIVSLKDKRYKNKVVIVQILGTWCPNCMDESRYLAPWYKKNKKRGVEIIGLSYEKFTDPKIALPKIAAMKKRFGMDYEVLLAGSNDNDKASQTLPMLNRVIGFPTTIFIDKTGKVKEIHTGFSGPGTGKYYDEFVNDFNRLIDSMVK